MLSCPLCGGDETRVFFRERPRGAPRERRYLHCASCDLRFLHPENRLTREDEEKRYRLHQNDVRDPRYRQFVRPLFDQIVARAVPGARGLEFGAGPGPVVAALLGEAGYDVALYDPFFHPDPAVLDHRYDFVALSEVAEHFYDPAVEFRRLRSLLNEDGFLAVMTRLHDSSIDFAKWSYRTDPTHVAFYSASCFERIKCDHRFSALRIIPPSVAILSAGEDLP
jgi:hypothetical protein